jgi:hypothetical protein
VHVYRSGNGSHPSFGELALMYSTPRAASIIADSPGQLWALHRNVFRKVLMRRSGRKVRRGRGGIICDDIPGCFDDNITVAFNQLLTRRKPHNTRPSPCLPPSRTQ